MTRRMNGFIQKKSLNLPMVKDSYVEGPGVDFSKDFKVFNAQQNNGHISNVEE